MPLVVSAASSAHPRGAISLPDEVSLGLEDTDGTGGDIFINGVGLHDPVNGLYDLQTIFTGAGLLFNSIPLLRAFRRLRATDTVDQGWRQLLSNLELIVYPLVVGGLTDAFNLRLDQTAVTLSGINFPEVRVFAPAGGEGYTGDSWRLELKLRHAITN